MCGGGGQSTFVVKYQRGYSGASGGTVIPTRTYTPTDGAFVSTGTGNYRGRGTAPQINNQGNNGYGRRSPTMTYSEFTNHINQQNLNSTALANNTYLYTFEFEAGKLGGPAVVTNGNSVTINNTTNVWGSVS